EIVLHSRGQSTQQIENLRREAMPKAPRENRRPSSFPRQRGARR
ncbi:MAG: hypothetical protein K0S65_2469, partial [Labilithrix sp.]|nr:hypothetical protein [Labilithrix sp.]